MLNERLGGKWKIMAKVIRKMNIKNVKQNRIATHKSMNAVGDNCNRFSKCTSRS